MLVAAHTGFGGFREDMIGALGPILGTGRVTSFITSLETEIRVQAEAGARQAIPDITLEVERAARRTIEPFVFAALALGVAGAVFGGLALWRSR